MSDDYTSEEEYLVNEPQAEYKSEFRAGRVVAMSGVTRNHSLIVSNTLAAIHTQLRGRPCEVHATDLRVKVETAHFYTYPDIAIVCGQPRFDARDKNALVNPQVILEVLSPATEAYDRGEKFGYYQKLPSLTDYVLIRQDRVAIEHFALREGAWRLVDTVPPAEVIEFASAGVRVVAADAYEKVEF